MLGESPQLGSHLLSPPLAVTRDIAANVNVTPITSRTAERLDNVTPPNNRTRTDSTSVNGTTTRQVRSRRYENILGQHHVNMANLFNSMNESLRYTVQHEQNAVFGPVENIMRNYAEAQRLRRLAVSTDDNESAEFYSNVIRILSNHVNRYASEDDNDDE